MVRYINGPFPPPFGGGFFVWGEDNPSDLLRKPPPHALGYLRYPTREAGFIIAQLTSLFRLEYLVENHIGSLVQRELSIHRID